VILVLEERKETLVYKDRKENRVCPDYKDLKVNRDLLGQKEILLLTQTLRKNSSTLLKAHKAKPDLREKLVLRVLLAMTVRMELMDRTDTLLS